MRAVTSATSVNGRSVATTPANALSTVPKVWVLLGEKAGGNGQLMSLADALEWPYETKQLRYNSLNHCPNLFLGPSILCCRPASIQRARGRRGRTW